MKKRMIWIGMLLVAFIAVDALAQENSESVEPISSDEEIKDVSPAAPVPQILELIQPGVRKKKGPFALDGERRGAEKNAMKNVDLKWGLVMRHYPVTDRFVKNMHLEEVDQPADITDRFSVIDFSKGSSVVYMPGIRKLIVQNTLGNLVRLEEILATFGAADKGAGSQIEIKTRFVEFSEGALEELGFEWSASDAIDLGGDWSLPQVDGEGQSLFADSLRSMPYVQPKSLGAGELSVDGNWGNIPHNGDWRVGRIEDLFSNTAPDMTLALDFGDRFDLLVRAMDQTSGVDVLSSPRIVAVNGETATIRIGELHNYPEVYEDGVSGAAVLHVRYEDFEEKLLGVEMTVTPRVKGNEIRLKINPKITDLVGWQGFELAPADSCYNYYQKSLGNEYLHEAVVARLPIIKRREIETDVSVTSGSTIGLGGLISEKTEAFDDRVPVLGSIPLIGRLFRSEGERMVKRNLMIFVTATKVTPDGSVVAGRSFE